VTGAEFSDFLLCLNGRLVAQREDLREPASHQAASIDHVFDGLGGGCQLAAVGRKLRFGLSAEHSLGLCADARKEGRCVDHRRDGRLVAGIDDSRKEARAFFLGQPFDVASHHAGQRQALRRLAIGVSDSLRDALGEDFVDARPCRTSRRGEGSRAARRWLCRHRDRQRASGSMSQEQTARWLDKGLG
jgi:hypothetical protein